MLTRSYMKPEYRGTLLAYSPMLHARMFSQAPKIREKYFQPLRSGLTTIPQPNKSFSATDLYLDGNPDLDRPLSVQFCANDPDELLAAAKYVQPFCDAVDLNLGCPQGIAKKGRYGAFLQEEPDLIHHLINKLHTELDVPVTAKIRILESKERTLEYARLVLSAGASILTVHGRQRDQKGHNTGLADWSVIRYLRENLPQETVIFANGNILRHEDITRCLEETKADGVMSADGNLHDPTIFSGPPGDPEDRSYWRGRDGRGGYRVDAVFRHYLSIIYRYVLEIPEPERPPLFHPSDSVSHKVQEPVAPEEPHKQPPAKRRKRAKDDPLPSVNLIAMQSHLFSLLQSLIVVHTDVRDALAKTQVGNMASYERVLRMTEKVIRDGLLDYERCPETYEDATKNGDTKPEDPKVAGHATDSTAFTHCETSLEAIMACRRPWWCCQPYIRPLPKEAIERGAMTIGRKEKRKLEEAVQMARKEQNAIEGAGCQMEDPLEGKHADLSCGKDNFVCG